MSGAAKKKAPARAPFAREVWDSLSSYDVSAHVERKGRLKYLSWSWAYAVLMNHYPESVVEWTAWRSQEGASPEGVRYLRDGTAEVECTVTVRDGDESIRRSICLPIMDNRNNAMGNPSARDVNDARMRAMVKCIGLFGLGLNLYAGEDLPTNSTVTPIRVEPEPRREPEQSMAPEYVEPLPPGLEVDPGLPSSPAEAAGAFGSVAAGITAYRSGLGHPPLSALSPANTQRFFSRMRGVELQVVQGLQSGQLVLADVPAFAREACAHAYEAAGGNERTSWPPVVNELRRMVGPFHRCQDVLALAWLADECIALSS